MIAATVRAAAELAVLGLFVSMIAVCSGLYTGAI